MAGWRCSSGNYLKRNTGGKSLKKNTGAPHWALFTTSSVLYTCNQSYHSSDGRENIFEKIMCGNCPSLMNSVKWQKTNESQTKKQWENYLKGHYNEVAANYLNRENHIRSWRKTLFFVQSYKKIRVTKNFFWNQCKWKDTWNSILKVLQLKKKVLLEFCIQESIFQKHAK